MEVVGENPEVAGAKDCIVEPGPAKQEDPDAKTLGNEQKPSGLAENAQENGARVSENRKEGSSGGFGVESDEKMKEDGFRVENVDESRDLEDSEMNGVSSLLKMKKDFGEKENNTSSSDAKDVGKEVGVQKEEDDDDEIDGGEEEHGFHVGDFVWGKIKSHPWWPGQIYDSSDASELALKIKQKRRLLVAYFGDGTFAWCHPSQLKPFVENFKEFSRVSTSKGFVNAVEEAVEEMGRHVECMVTCGCAQKEGLRLDDGLIRPAATNAGIKEGVLVPEIRREIVSCFEFEPEKIIGDAKAFAETVPLNDLLEFEVLKRKISAFYRAKGGYSLTEYHEPKPIPGLEDKNVERPVKLRGSEGSVGEDGLNPEESRQRSLERCSGFLENRLHHKRKQKSIAEILETDTNNQAKTEEVAHGIATTSRKKRKRNDEAKGDVGKTSNTSATTRRRRRVSEISIVEDNSKEKEKPLPRKRRKRSPDVEYLGNGEREETALVEESEKKKNSGSEDDVDSTPLASLRKKIKINVSGFEKDSSKDETPKVQTPSESLSRERKRSKYLSPPYTTEFSSKAKRNGIEAEPMKVSSQAHVGEQASNVTGNIIKTTSEETPTDKSGEVAAVGDLGHQESVDELRKAADFLRLGAPPDELKNLIRAAALGPQYAKDDCSEDLIREFMSIYRSFTYHDGANSKIPQRQDLGKEKENENENETTILQKKKQRKSEKKSADTKKQDFLGTELFVNFGSGSSLPTKDDLVKTYGKFGPLDNERTDVFNEDSYARVAFMNTSDAGKAYNSSLKKCPFVVSSSTVTFRLNHGSASPKTPNERRRKKTTGNMSAPEKSESEKASTEIEYVKEKLEMMRSMVDKSEGAMTVELKMKLEKEMRNLLEKVSKMGVPSS